MLIMADPYRAPESVDHVEKEVLSHGYKAPILGCLSGGCLAPILLFFFCALVLRDTGGPLFWPFAAVFFGLIGMVIGFVVRASKKP